MARTPLIRFIGLILLAGALSFIAGRVDFGSQEQFQVADFSETGYQILLTLEKDVVLSDLDYDKIVGLDVSLPCCAFAHIQPKYEDNCRCNHHLVLYGLAKEMARKGASRDQIQSEINTWKVYFFPESYGSSQGAC